jgi:hypothetical protein
VSSSIFGLLFGMATAFARRGATEELEDHSVSEEYTHLKE